MRAQAGSEVKCEQLEQFTEKSRQTSRTIEYFKNTRDHAAKFHTKHTAQCWMPATTLRLSKVHDEEMIAQKPIGVIIFPNSGVTENLAGKAKAPWHHRQTICLSALSMPCQLLKD